jgi:transmembrane 9 superfamily protein 2/4
MQLEETYRIVEFDVLPQSRDWGEDACYSPLKVAEQVISSESSSAVFTYSVSFKMSDVGWAHRYDHYMKTERDNIHYLNLFASIGLTISLLLLVARHL